MRVKEVERKHIAIGPQILAQEIPWAVAGKREIPCCPESRLNVGPEGILDSQTVYTKEKTSHGCKMGLDSCGDGTHKFCQNDIKNLCPN
jgi:hypothetical protein